MNVTPQENEQYRKFVSEVAQRLGVFDFDPNQVVWHYTDAAGFLGILQSATIYATQVAALNDANETKYATDLFKSAVKQVIQEKVVDTEAVEFLNEVLEFVKDAPESPTHGTSKFFVTCFSADEDELTQWKSYAKTNGYAIGFYARGFFREANSTIYKVVYDRQKQVEAAKELADATLRFYREGLNEERQKDPQAWAKVFFEAWDEWIYKLAPLAKDQKWKSENEYRIVHELRGSEFPKIRFVQRQTQLGRYLPLDTPYWVKNRSPLLPVAKVWIGPGTHQSFTRISVRLLLDQMGYANIPVEMSEIKLTPV